MGFLCIFEYLKGLKIYDIYLSAAVGLSPGGSSTVHIYTQTIHRTIQQFWKNVGRDPSWLFALQPRKKHGKTSVRVAASKNT